MTMMDEEEINVFCNFITEDMVHFRCTKCGMEIIADSIQDTYPIFICAYSTMQIKDNQDLKLSDKIKNFASSLYGHINAGMPMCTEEQIEKRFDLCRSCEFFKNNVCQKCGCPLIRHKKFISKLAWADQECPIGKWGKEI